MVLTLSSAVKAHEPAVPIEPRTLQRFFESSPALLATLGFDGRFKAVNAAWVSALGYPIATVLAKPYIELVHPDDRAAASIALDKLMRGGTVTHFVNRCLAKDATYRMIDWNCAVDLEDELMYCVGADITDLGLTQDAIAEKADLLDLAHDAIVMVGSDDMKIRFWNQGAATLYGYRADEAMGWRSSELLLAELPEPIEQILASVRDKGRWEGQIRHRTKLGAEVIVESRWALRRDISGRPDAILEINRDITARIQAQDALLAANTRLERRVDERTQQLLAINRDLEAFSHTVAHDLRAPMRAINSFADILLSEDHSGLDAEARDALSEIQSNAARGAKLIDELLELSRIGRHLLQPVVIDMTVLAQRAAKVLAPEFVGRDIKLDIKPMPASHGDSPMLEMVFINLISNAIKFSAGKAPAVIEVGAEVRPDGTVYYVKDNGAGFDMKYADKLFGVFQRLHSRAEFDGNGVGLASVQRILQRHRGRIWALAELGKGATLYFTVGERTNA